MDTSFSYEVIFLKRKASLLLAVILLISIFTIHPKAGTQIIGAGRVNTSGSSLNVRSSPSASSTVKASLKNNTYISLISETGDFWYVRYSNGGYGYCHKNYIYHVSSAVRQVKTTSGNLRVRVSPSTTAQIKDSLPSGTFVTVHTADSAFAKIIYHGNKVGYVSRNYLVKPDNFTGNFSAISLKVPNYKQTDSRWKNVTLGSSGQTIGKIGCATTALAMTESYRTGTTIYPNAMAKKLTYTSGGAVYWPTNYNIITSQSGYLQTIYSALQSGKPVIVGAKNTYGGQHYVVVTGVKACNTLTTSAFYINDPGSNTRTTLNQFFSAYPNFYKMLYVK